MTKSSKRKIKRQKPKITNKVKIYVPSTLWWLTSIDYLNKLNDSEKLWLTHFNKFIYRRGSNDIINSVDKAKLSPTLNTDSQFKDAMSRFPTPIEEVSECCIFKESVDTTYILSKLFTASLTEEESKKVVLAHYFLEEHNYLPSEVEDFLQDLYETYFWY